LKLLWRWIFCCALELLPWILTEIEKSGYLITVAKIGDTAKSDKYLTKRVEPGVIVNSAKFLLPFHLLLLLKFLLNNEFMFPRASLKCPGCSGGSDPSLNGRVPVILDGIVCSARKQFCDFRPLVPELAMSMENNVILLLSPWSLVNLRVKVVVPPFPALLSNTALEGFGDKRPLFGPVLVHEFHDLLVFLFCPLTFYEGGGEDFAPSRRALHLRTVREVRRDLGEVR